MENVKVLSKEVTVENDRVVITEQVETTMDINQLEQKLRNIQMQKSSLLDQNARIVIQYNKYTEEENDVLDLLSQLKVVEGIKIL